MVAVNDNGGDNIPKPAYVFIIVSDMSRFGDRAMSVHRIMRRKVLSFHILMFLISVRYMNGNDARNVTAANVRLRLGAWSRLI